MMKLNWLFRRGHGPPSSGSGGRSGKRGASSASGSGQAGAAAPAPAAAAPPPGCRDPPPAAAALEGVEGPQAAARAAHPNGSLPRQLPHQQPEVLVRSFGSAEIGKQAVGAAPPQQEQPQGLKGASSISSLDSKRHKFHLPKQLQLRGSKARAAPPDAPLSAAATNGNPAAAVATPVPSPTAPAAVHNNNNSNNINNNHHHHNSSGVSAMELELESVQDELEKVSRDKMQLQLRVEELSGCQGELQSLRQEVARLREQQTAGMELSIENMSSHNGPLSDTEKEQLLLNSSNLQKSPVPASVNNGVVNDLCPTTSTNGVLPDVLDPTCVTPDRDRDWDKHSCSSLSEVSVACLQDRIMQMEETHYSTNEELQATLQELADLQAQLTEQQSENERLTEEKGVLLESLRWQTEKLEDSRAKVDTLHELLLREEAGNGPGGGGDAANGQAEREQKLVELLKSGQEEREALLVKQEELTTELIELRGATDSHAAECARLTDRVRLLESTVDATHAERKQLDQELALAKEESSSRHIEISRLSTLLENARSKIEELDHARELGDKSEIEALLDNVRKEKDVLEGQVASLQEQLSRSQCEVSKLREQLSSLQEECKVMRNNAKCAKSDLEYQCEQIRKEKSSLATELATLQESASELRLQVQCHLEDKRQLKAALSEGQRHCADIQQRLAIHETELAEEKRLRSEESAEWQQFQSDLLMTVRVANDFKTEAQHELEKLVLENKTLRDKNRSLESQVEKLKGPGGSRSSSTSSLSSIASDVRAASVAVGTANFSPSTPSSPLRHLTLADSETLFKGPLRDQQSNNQNNNNQLHNNNNNNMHSNNRLVQQQSRKNVLSDNGKANSLDSLKGSIGKPCEDGSQVSQAPLALGNLSHHPGLTTPVSILASKSMDYTRRNSCGDLSERKDPLAPLVKNGGSKRNALLKWCQNKTVGYRNIDITNFSSSWNDGLAFCAILHSYLPDRVPYDSLTPNEKRRNFTIAFAAAESVGIPTTLNINDMIQLERPDWQQIMAYVTAIYIHFET